MGLSQRAEPTGIINFLVREEKELKNGTAALMLSAKIINSGWVHLQFMDMTKHFGGIAFAIT